MSGCRIIAEPIALAKSTTGPALLLGEIGVAGALKLPKGDLVTLAHEPRLL